MRRGVDLPAQRQARCATSEALRFAPASPAGQSRQSGDDYLLSQRELRAGDRNWSEGRIAKCLRLQRYEQLG
jgi:hypothetical protein